MRSQYDLEGATREFLGVAIDQDWRLTTSHLADVVYQIADDLKANGTAVSTTFFLTALADAFSLDWPERTQLCEPFKRRWRFDLRRTPKGGLTFNDAVRNQDRERAALAAYEGEIAAGKLVKEALGTVVERGFAETDRSAERLISNALKTKDRLDRTIRQLVEGGYIPVKPNDPAT
jgi:hypothetical protein